MKPDPKKPHDPYRLAKFVGLHAATGIVAGWVALLILLWTDIGGLGSLVARAERSEMATVMLAIGFGVSFGFVGITWGVLAVLPHEKD
ncbi:hypothetical protein P2H44_08475 [Albimonas sp. CAU 1670]|uniref:hypothetical protein n=1 Tax=Albimonas sp. CAU 1670 TaxID=3032599 RepID=UPI0023DB63DD|nr:hypothetical protein [Albimonas sp. CAU 1670]MDF2232584.1 hypothetical protein [Albimonas sp. CAU 1670]